MAEEIGEKWVEGEQCASKALHLDALFHYMQAKAMLVAEANKDKGTPAGNQRSKAICQEILTKLEKSIFKSTEIMRKNPVAALGLKRGFKRSDIKKAYHKLALQYHPDKNPEHDTSSIFTCIQSAYESLMQATSVSTEPQQQYQPAQQQQQSSASASSSTPRASPRGVPSKGPSDQQQQRRPSKAEGSGIASLPSDYLRSVLRECGFSNVEAMNRDELVKRFLAVNAHFNFNFRGQQANQSNRSDEDSKKKFESEMRQQREKERERERVRQEAKANLPSSFADSSRSQQAAGVKGESSQQKVPMDHKRTDERRRERVEQLERDLPKMSISELKVLMSASGLSSEGCFEKADLLAKLYHFYGIVPRAQQQPGPTSTTAAPTGPMATPAEAAMKSRFAHLDKQQNDGRRIPPLDTNNSASSNVPSKDQQGSGINVSPRANDVNTDNSCDSSAAPSSQKTVPKVVLPSALFSKDKLKELERKLFNSSASTSTSSSASSSGVPRPPSGRQPSSISKAAIPPTKLESIDVTSSSSKLRPPTDRNGLREDESGASRRRPSKKNTDNSTEVDDLFPDVTIPASGWVFNKYDINRSLLSDDDSDSGDEDGHLAGQGGSGEDAFIEHIRAKIGLSPEKGSSDPTIAASKSPDRQLPAELRPVEGRHRGRHGYSEQRGVASGREDKRIHTDTSDDKASAGDGEVPVDQGKHMDATMGMEASDGAIPNAANIRVGTNLLDDDDDDYGSDSSNDQRMFYFDDSGLISGDFQVFGLHEINESDFLRGEFDAPVNSQQNDDIDADIAASGKPDSASSNGRSYVDKLRRTAEESNTKPTSSTSDSPQSKPKQSVPAMNFKRVKQHSGEDAKEIQEEVEFWVHSARDDRAAGNSFEALVSGRLSLSRESRIGSAEAASGQQDASVRTSTRVPSGASASSSSNDATFYWG